MNSAVNVFVDAPGAMVTLFGPAGRAISSCQAPCSFNDLVPARYSLQVQKDGYLPVQTAVELKQHESLDQRIYLDALAKGLYVSSRPAGAEVFINGAKQSGQTPTTLPLAPGQYDLVLRIPGYEAYAGHVQVKDNIQTTLDVELKKRHRFTSPGRRLTPPPAAERSSSMALRQTKPPLLGSRFRLGAHHRHPAGGISNRQAGSTGQRRRHGYCHGSSASEIAAFGSIEDGYSEETPKP